MIQRRVRTLFWTALAAAITCSTAAYATSGDCPPFGRMQNYVAQEEPQLRNHDAVEFRIAKSDGAEEIVMVAGRACRQHYSIKDGAQPASDLEIQQNYLSQVQKFGVQKLFGSDRNLQMRFTQGGKEFWLALSSQETD